MALAVAVVAGAALPVAGQQPQRAGKGPQRRAAQPVPDVSFEGDRVEVPSRFDGRHTFVRGWLGAGDGIDVLIDTGSGASILGPGLVRELGLAKVGERTVLSGGTDPVTADIVVVPELAIGDLSIRNAQFLVLDVLGDRGVMVGMGAFRDYLLTFDPARGAIVVERGALSAEDPDVLPFEQRGAIQIDVDVAGRTVRADLDTGSQAGLTLPYALRDSVRLAGPLTRVPDARLVGGTRSQWRGVVDGVVSIGGLTYEDPEVHFVDPAVAGNVGGQVLQDAKLTIDQRNGLLALRPYPAGTRRVVASRPGASGASGAPASRRLGFGLNPRDGTIRLVEPGSLADEAGLREGDVIVSINGRSIAEHGSGLPALLRGSEPLVFLVDRDGGRVEIRIE